MNLFCPKQMVFYHNWWHLDDNDNDNECSHMVTIVSLLQNFENLLIFENIYLKIV